MLSSPRNAPTPDRGASNPRRSGRSCAMAGAPRANAAPPSAPRKKIRRLIMRSPVPSGIFFELIYVANMLVEYITFKKMPGIGVFPCFVAGRRSSRLDDPLHAGCRSITSPRCCSSVLASPISRGSCDQPRPTLQDMPRSQPTKKQMAMSSSTRVDGDRPLRRSSLKLTSRPGSPREFGGLFDVRLCRAGPTPRGRRHRWTGA